MNKKFFKLSLLVLSGAMSATALADPYISAAVSGQFINNVDSYNTPVSYNVNAGYAFSFVPGPVSPLVEIGLRDWGGFKTENQYNVNIGRAYDAMAGVKVRIPFIGEAFVKGGAMLTYGSVSGGSTLQEYMPVTSIGLGYAFPFVSIYTEYFRAYGKAPVVTNGSLNNLPSMNAVLLGVAINL